MCLSTLNSARLVATIGPDMSGQWWVISGQFANFMAALCLAVDVIGAERVGKAVATAHNFLEKRRRTILYLAFFFTAIIFLLVFQFTDLEVHLGNWLADTMKQSGPVTSFGISILALVLYLASMGQHRLKSVLIKAKWKETDNLILDALIVVVIGLGVAALATGNIVVQVYSIAVGIALAVLTAILWPPRVFLTGVERLIKFVNSPTATVKRFGIIGLALLVIGFTLNIIGIALVLH